MTRNYEIEIRMRVGQIARKIATRILWPLPPHRLHLDTKRKSIPRKKREIQAQVEMIRIEMTYTMSGHIYDLEHHV